MDAVQNWTEIHPDSIIYEERPYRQCPNCDRYKFRATKIYKGGLLTVKRTEYTESCKNCKYEGDSWTKKDTEPSG